MTQKRIVAQLCLATLLFAAAISAQTQPAAPKAPPAPIDISGDWTGTWSSYSPANGATPPKEVCAHMTAKIALENGVWQATFEGDCGRPYKYNIKMEGRQAGKSVMFKGSADLGARDGGVFDWIGRANEKEFIGFYTSAYSTGVFSLTRAPK